MMDIKQISTTIFGKFILKKNGCFFIDSIQKEKIITHFKKKLIIARIEMQVHEYLSLLFFICSIVFLFFFIAIISMIIVYIYGIIIPFNIYIIPILMILMSLVLITLMAIAYWYPDIIAHEIKRKIDANLPYSFSYFSIMSAIGIPPYKIFYEIGEAENIYGEVSNESKLIIRDVDLFGHDIITAFKNISNITPSTNFKKILQGAITTTTAGGKISDYFLLRSQEFMQEKRKKYEEFIETLSMVSEIYITAMVAGPLFLITLLSGLAMAGELHLRAMQFMVYVFIPLGTLIFIFFIDVISIDVEGSHYKLKSEGISTHKELELKKIESNDSEYILNKLNEIENISTYKKFLKDPIATIYEKPFMLIYISLCFTIFFIIIGKLVFDLHMGDIAIGSILILITPFGIYHYYEQKKIRLIHENFPDIFHDMARAKKSGISIQNAIHLVANNDYNILNKSLQKMDLWLSWNISFKDVLEQFNKHHNTPLINRSIFTILAAHKIGGDVGIVMEKVADDAYEYMILNKKREMETAPYLAVGYISFFVFMLVIIILHIFFLPMLYHMDMMDVAHTLEVILFHSLIIQGFCIGIFIGKIGMHSIYAGIKHSIILVVIAYIAYTITIMYL